MGVITYNGYYQREEYQEWLKSIKEGDEVVVIRSGGISTGYSYSIHTVQKVTPTGRIKLKHTEFNPNGTERGNTSSGYSRIRHELQPYTSEVKKYQEKEQLFKEFEKLSKQVTMKNVSSKSLSSLVNIIQKELE